MFFTKSFIFIQILFHLSQEREVTHNLSTKLLPDGYNREIAPTFNDSAVEVNVSVSILSVTPESDTKMNVYSEQAFNVDLFLHLYWTDNRFQEVEGAPEIITLGCEWKDRLWVPDTYFRNAISGGVAYDVLSPSCYFYIKNSSNVFMAARLRMKIGCNMKFHKYPFDRQLCFLNITTLSQSIDTVRLKWNTFKVGSHVQLPEYHIISETKGNCLKNYSSVGNFPCLYVAINFKRNVGNYLIKRFIPSFLIVWMSFMGFWIPTSIAPARVSLIITALLALIAQQIQGELNVSYVYALQIWTIMCIVFVFASLLEYAIAISWSFCDQSSEDNSSEDQTNKKMCFLRATSKNCIIDIVSRVLFPISFMLCLVVFVLIYSNMSSE